MAAVQLPDAASLQRTDRVVKKVEEIVQKTPGVKYCTSIVGYNMISQVMNTYSGFFSSPLRSGRNARSLKRNTKQSRRTSIVPCSR